MKLFKTTLILLFICTFICCKNSENNKLTDKDKTAQEELKIIPFQHASFILKYGEIDIYVDPTGEANAYEAFGNADIILITDIHGDHYNIKTLSKLDLSNATIIAPEAVVAKFPEEFKPKYNMLNNNESVSINNITVEAIPMYNLREEALKFHTKGRGNGYVLTINNERIYISGDTEDIPEMRDLKDIDKAFVCMNLPWTMPVESAASAVLEFKPKTVFPYHYRGSQGMSDVNLFKEIVNKADKSIEVQLLDWY